MCYRELSIPLLTQEEASHNDERERITLVYDCNMPPLVTQEEASYNDERENNTTAVIYVSLSDTRGS